MRTLCAALVIVIAGVSVAASETARPACIIPSQPPAHIAGNEIVSGHYRTVSESEWNVELWLHSDGSAEVLWEAWNAGEFEERTSTRWLGEWFVIEGFVALSYDGRCETLRFSPTLSFEEFGSEGSAPGLQGILSSLSTKLFLRHSMWQVAHLEALPDPG